MRRSIEQWNHSQINKELLQRDIKWRFNPPTGSHHARAWERLIHSIRKVLNSTLRVEALDEEGLHMVLCEVEAILNSRPITKSSTDPNDLEALTPNHLLLLKTQPSLPPGLFQREDLGCSHMETSTVHVQLVLEKMDERISATASGTSKVDQSQAQFNSWRRHTRCG